jgi:PAS domain S-box-containing protein
MTEPVEIHSPPEKTDGGDNRELNRPRWQATRVAVIGLVFLVIAAAAAVITVVNTDRVVRLTAEAQRVREAAFVFTGAADEAAAFRASRTEMGLQLEQMARDAQPEQRPRLSTIRELLMQRSGQGAELVGLVETGALPQAREMWPLVAGARSALDAREEIERFRATNSQILEDMRRDYNSAASRQLIALLAGGLAVLLFGAHQIRSTYHYVDELKLGRARLRQANQDLERQVNERTLELSRINQLFATSLNGSKVTAFSQDRDLVYTWIHNPRFGMTPEAVIGKSDLEILPVESRDRIVALKREVIRSGRSITEEVSVGEGDEVSWYRLHADPLYEGRRVAGVVCAAVDITEEKLGAQRLRSLTDDLSATVQRFEVALRAANIVEDSPG